MTTSCPQCDWVYEYDNDTDGYVGCIEKVVGQAGAQEVWLYLCTKCEGVVGMIVNDQHGATVYVPCMESP